ncbi:ATP-dependent nuclease [Amphritea pacifica]|uniref:AAA family ATPase n=1 Tax=Amphritea pacifica TaxID=2811233 RepID=A0ABS2W4H9_9GAMM|nr:AAA family ATPase [Amphritea pacifica]MBN0986443.1 AAA family ATPase [Amphritea pacifica]
MIFSLFLRNYKVYQNINYIPVSEATCFSALVGENGTGKSTVLESLDSYFNHEDWNLNHSVLQKGYAEREPYICPIFLIEKSKVHHASNIYKYLSIFSSITWQVEPDDFNPSNKKLASFFCWHRERLSSRGVSDETHFLFPLGLRKTGKTTIIKDLSIFKGISDYQDHINDDLRLVFDDVLDRIYDYLTNSYRYIYIPSDIDFEQYTKIEGDTVQSLMGRKIEEIVKGFIDDNAVKEINAKLDDFVKDISESLVNYEYKKYAKRQSKVNLTHLSSKVVEAYFDDKYLNLIDGDESTPIYNLSSGEKRKAIIDVAKAFLKEAKVPANAHIIFAVDEPEISLHVASCFEQFQKLKDVSGNDVQVVITTHWYGFMPIVSEGTAIYLPGDQVRSCLIDLRCFRDDIKLIKTHTRGRQPANLELKGINDLVQSIISSITGSACKWIICEGVSDKIYLDKYFERDDVYILPIGKSKYVKKIFNHLMLALDEEKDSIKGRVFLMVDTDKQIEISGCSDLIPKIIIRRLQNDEKSMQTSLRKLSDTSVYPPTEIEDALDASVFHRTIAELLVQRDIVDEFDELKDISVQIKDAPSGLAFNLNQSQLRELERFFNQPKIKVEFALNYVANLEGVDAPGWIKEIADVLQVEI